MASEKDKIYFFFSLCLIINYMKTITATNINCNGKPFHCVNSTHFMICVDLGGGVSTTVDDFVIQCPPTTACRANNYFECEYQTPTTLDSIIGQGDETTHFEYDAKTTSTWSKVTTEVPLFQQTTEILGEYFSIVSVTPSETQTQYANTIDDTTVISTQVDDSLSTSDMSLNYSDIFTYEASEVEIITRPPSIKRPFNNDSLRSLKISNNEGLIQDAVDTISTLSSTINNNIPTEPRTFEYTTTLYPITEPNNLITPILFDENITQNITVRKQAAVIDETRKTHYDTTTLLNLNEVLSTTFKYNDSMSDNYNFATDSNLLSPVTVPDFVTETDVNKKVVIETTDTVSSGIDKTTTELFQYQVTTESTLFHNSFGDPVNISDLNLIKAETDHTDKTFVTYTNTILETNKLHTSRDKTTDITLIASVFFNSTELPSLVTKEAEATLVEVGEMTVPTITEDLSSITKTTEPSLYLESVTGGNVLEDNHIFNIEYSNNYTLHNYIKEKNTNRQTEPSTGEVPISYVVQEATREVTRSTSNESWKYQKFTETNAPVDSYATGTWIQETTTISIRDDYTTIMPETEFATIVNITEKDRTEIPSPELYLQDQATTGINLHETSYMPNNDKFVINKTNTQSTSTTEKKILETELFTMTATKSSFIKPDLVTNLISEEAQKINSTENNITLLSTPELITTEVSIHSKLSTNSSYAPELIVSNIIYNNDNSDVTVQTEVIADINEVATEPGIAQVKVTEAFPLTFINDSLLGNTIELDPAENDVLPSTHENIATEISIQSKSMKSTDTPEFNITTISQNNEYLNVTSANTEIVENTTEASATQENVTEVSPLTFLNNTLLTRDSIPTDISVQSKFSVDSTNKPEFIVSPISNNNDYFNATKVTTAIPGNAIVVGVTQEIVTATPATSIYDSINQVTEPNSNRNQTMIDVKSDTNSLNISSNFVDEIPATSVFEMNQKGHVERESLSANINESLHTQVLNHSKEIDKNVFYKYLEIADTTMETTTIDNFKNILRTDGEKHDDKMFHEENTNISTRLAQVSSNKDVLGTTVTLDTTESTATYIILNNIQIINGTLDINQTRLIDQFIIDTNVSGDMLKNEAPLNSTQSLEIISSTERPLVTVLVQESFYPTIPNGTDSLANMSYNITSEHATNNIDFTTTENKNGLVGETPDSFNKIISFENQDLTEINQSRGIYYTLTEKNDSYTDSYIIRNDYENSFKESVSAVPIKTLKDKNIQDNYKNFPVENDIHASSTTESTRIYSSTMILSDTPITDTVYNVIYITRPEIVEFTHGTNFNQGYENVDDINKTVIDKLPSDVVGNIKPGIYKKNDESPLVMTTDSPLIDNNQQKSNTESPHVIEQKSIVPVIFANNINMAVNNTFENDKTIGSIDRKHVTDFSNVFNNIESYTPTVSHYNFSDDLKKSINKIETQDILDLNYTNNNLYPGTVNESNEIHFGKPKLTILQQKEMDTLLIGDAAITPLKPIADDKLLSKSIKKTKFTQNIVVNNAENIVQEQNIAIKTETSRDSYNENPKLYVQKVDDELRDNVNNTFFVSESKIRNETDGGNILNKVRDNSKVTINITDNRQAESYIDFNTESPFSTPLLGNTTSFTYNNSNNNKDTDRSSPEIGNEGNIYVGNNIDVRTNTVSESSFKYKKGLANDTTHELKNIQNNVVKFNSSYYQKIDEMQQSASDNVSANVTSKLIHNNPSSSNKNNYYDAITKSPPVVTAATINNNSKFSDINNRGIISNDIKLIYKNNIIPRNKGNSTTLNISWPTGTENALIQNTTDQFNLKRKFVSPSLRTTDLITKNATVNPALFTCQHRFRGRYADKNDCAKFYICIGKTQPLYGKCPTNTVFSEIKKQCTKNLSHCIRNNQFHCLKEGRFSDALRNNIYYICVKNNNVYIRFQFQCQTGYSLNKTCIRCAKDLNTQVSSTSNDSDSNRGSSQSTVEHLNNSKEKKNLKLSAESFICSQEGKFPYKDDCRRYYVCSKNSKSVFRRKIKKCDSDEMFQKEKQKCVNDDSYDC